MKVKERQERIVAILQDRGEVSVEDLVTELERSAETIRRDLGELAEAGLVQKVHGGVKLPSRRLENHFSHRMQVNADGKRAIGRAFADWLHPGDTVFMDTGSTTYYCAEALRHKEGICVITNSFDIAEVLGPSDGVHVIVIGGTYFPDNRQSVGALAIRNISLYRPEYAVITVGGVDQTGVMDFNIKEASLAAAMIENAQKTIVLADHLKLDRTCAFKVADLSKIDALITDRTCPENLRQSLASEGVDLHLASDHDPQPACEERSM